MNKFLIIKLETVPDSLSPSLISTFSFSSVCPQACPSLSHSVHNFVGFQENGKRRLRPPGWKDQHGNYKAILCIYGPHTVYTAVFTEGTKYFEIL